MFACTLCGIAGPWECAYFEGRCMIARESLVRFVAAALLLLVPVAGGGDHLRRPGPGHHHRLGGCRHGRRRHHLFRHRHLHRAPFDFHRRARRRGPRRQRPAGQINGVTYSSSAIAINPNYTGGDDADVAVITLCPGHLRRHTLLPYNTGALNELTAGPGIKVGFGVGGTGHRRSPASTPTAPNAPART